MGSVLKSQFQRRVFEMLLCKANVYRYASQHTGHTKMEMIKIGKRDHNAHENNSMPAYSRRENKDKLHHKSINSHLS